LSVFQKKIIEEYLKNEGDIKGLCEELELSERQVYRILFSINF